MNDSALSRFDPRGKLARHPQFAAFLAGEKVYPVGLEISPCGVCNASCRGCWYIHGAAGSHRKEFLETWRLGQVLQEAAGLGVKAVTWTGGGEPTLHPDFPELVVRAHEAWLAQGLFTNALATPKYEPSLLDWIRVTMTDRPYKIDCIRPLRACKTLGFAFNYGGAHDDDYLLETLAVAKTVGADYCQVRPELPFRGATADIKPPYFDHPLLHVTGYKFEEARKKHGYKECLAYHFCPFLWEDGNLDVCAYMGRVHDGYTLGNVYKDSLKDILDRAPLSVPVREDCQVCCKLHEGNEALHAAMRLEDVNFP